MKDVTFVAANTDAQALKHNLAPQKLQLGPNFTRGLVQAEDQRLELKQLTRSRAELEAVMQGADMVF